MRLCKVQTLASGLLMLSCLTAAAGEPNYPAGYVREAALPEGFPPPSEPGTVVEKEYPLSRSFSATGDGQFMKCFSYLSLKGHEMTAPVVMEYQASKERPKRERDKMEPPVDVQRMHFMLERAALDEPKQGLLVRVADMPKMRVLSYAHQGRMDAAKVAEIERTLKQELQRRTDLKAAGEPRLLGYNGPGVSKDKAFWEVQIPVEAAK